MRPLHLAVCAGSLGDALFVLPAVQHLQKRAEVVLAGTAPFQNLGAELIGVRRVQPIDSAFQEKEETEEKCPYEAVTVFFKDEIDVARSFFESRFPCPVYAPHAPFDEKISPIVFFLETAGAEKTFPPPQPRLKIPPTLKTAGLRLLEKCRLFKPFIAFHPGSGSPKKNAPLSFFRWAAREAQNHGFMLLGLFGEAEWEHLTRIKKELPENVVWPPSPFPLPHLCAVLSHASGYFGNDSGPTHLAAALELPAAAFFGPTDPAVWASPAACVISCGASFEKCDSPQVRTSFRTWLKTLDPKKTS